MFIKHHIGKSQTMPWNQFIISFLLFVINTVKFYLFHLSLSYWLWLTINEASEKIILSINHYAVIT